MTLVSKQLTEYIERPVDEVYEYASDPANLPAWAPGLGTSVGQTDGRWWVETESGRVRADLARLKQVVEARA
jgi:uncharacterized membrane protein